MAAKLFGACGVLSLVAACSDSLPDWPAPEPAAATCSYEISPSPKGAYASKSTVYYDERGRVFRVDGFDFSSPRLERGSYYFEYDEQDRLVHIEMPTMDISYRYSDAQIVETDSASSLGSDTYDLVGGRVSLWQGPLGLPEAERNSMRYEYDSAGRITRLTSAIRYDNGDGKGIRLARGDSHYTYDGDGSLIRIERDNGETLTFTWTRTLQEDALTMERKSEVFGLEEMGRLAIHYDAEKRISLITRDDVFGSATLEYTYAPDQIIETHTSGTQTFSTTATGTCPAIAVDFAPRQPLPIRWTAFGIRQLDPDAEFNWFVDRSISAAPFGAGGP